MRNNQTPAQGAREEAEHEQWLRKQAIQIAGQLPPDTGDAARIIEYVRAINDGFLRVGAAETTPIDERRFSLHVETTADG